MNLPCVGWKGFPSCHTTLTGLLMKLWEAWLRLWISPVVGPWTSGKTLDPVTSPHRVFPPSEKRPWALKENRMTPPNARVILLIITEGRRLCILEVQMLTKQNQVAWEEYALVFFFFPRYQRSKMQCLWFDLKTKGALSCQERVTQCQLWFPN